MKIYVFGTRWFPNIQGGVEKHCEALYTGFSNELQITVFRRKPYIQETPLYPNIFFKDICSTKIKGIEALFHSFLCTLICIYRRPDIIHIHNIGPGCFIPLLRLFKLKVVLTYHSANYEHKKWGRISKLFLKLSEFIALQFSNRVIFVNRFRMEKQPLAIQKKSNYIPNGICSLKRIEQTDYISSLGLTPHKYILAVGRITPEKGFDDLIDAFAQMNRNNYKLVIAGGVEHEISYFNYIKDKSGNLPVIYTGFLTSKYLQELYTHADIFVLSSHNEGFPLVVLEAMQLGCDILLSDIAATRLLKLPEENYFVMGNINDLVSKLENKLNNKSSTICRYNLMDFNWENIRQQTKEIYDSLMQKTI